MGPSPSDPSPHRRGDLADLWAFCILLILSGLVAMVAK